MSKKQNAILDYIKNLDIGTKVSIRMLAEHLNVSEGTAYKAIKTAEEAGLVHTRPRAGTVRIQNQVKESASFLTVNKLIQCLGLSIIVPHLADFQIASFVVGDGTPEQLIENAKRIQGNIICIVGNRPDIHDAALKNNMHLLITGNTNLPMELIQEASKRQLCILSSHHSSHNILHFIHTCDHYTASDNEMNRVGDWMHTPEYLYYNDILSDWYRTCFPIFALNDKFAIVNDELKICGSLNAAAIIHASPEERISELYDPNANIELFTIPHSASVHETAQKMISNNTELLFTEYQGKLCGYITANDLLRYYHYQKPISETRSAFSLIHTEYLKNQCKQTYRITSGYSISKEKLMELVSEIANTHVQKFFKKNTFTVLSGNFYTTVEMTCASEFNVCSEIISLSETQCLCEISIVFADNKQWKYTFHYMLN